MISPIKERYIIISKVSSVPASSRPATAMAVKETIAPIMKTAALMGCDWGSVMAGSFRG